MLTIREPLSLKSLSPICKMQDPFSEKIRSNYDMLQAKFSEEELLYMVTQPPEIYMGEGGMTNLIYDTKIQNNQNIKMDMMNNLINRITLMSTAEFTYQDTVYIQNILQKLGITEVSTFMKQVQNLQEDTNHTHQLIDLYWDNIQLLQNVVTNVQQESKEQRTEETEPTNDRSIYFLHDSIFKRLKTALIYEQLKQYYAPIGGQESQILQREILMSEQSRQAQNILLNKLQNLVQLKEKPVLYYRYNLYEEGDDITEAHTMQNTASNVTSAVLLNLLDNIYGTRFEQILNHRLQWFDISHALQYASDNTLQRYDTIRNHAVYQLQQNKEYTTNLKQARKDEITVLEKILYAVHNEEANNYSNIQNLTEHANTNQYSRQMIELLTKEKLTQQSITTRLLEHPVTYEISEQKEVQYNQQEENKLWNHLKKEEFTRNRYYLEMQQNIENHNTEEYRQQLNVTNEEQQETHDTKIENEENYYEIIKKELDVINQQNEQHMQEMQNQEIHELQNITINQAKSRRDALKALEDPEGAIMEFLNISEKVETYGQLEEHMETLISENDKEIYRLVEEYQKNPTRIIAESIVRIPTQEQLHHDITKVVKEHEPAIIEYIQGEPVQEQIENIVEHYQDPETKWSKTSKKIEEITSHIELVHKQVENTLGEDILEEIQYQNHVLQKKTETVEHEEITNQTIVTHNHTMTNEIKEQISGQATEVLRDGLQNQLNSISEQVYNRLEKKLTTERKRRGY